MAADSQYTMGSVIAFILLKSFYQKTGCEIVAILQIIRM